MFTVSNKLVAIFNLQLSNCMNHLISSKDFFFFLLSLGRMPTIGGEKETPQIQLDLFEGATYLPLFFYLIYMTNEFFSVVLISLTLSLS